jgi:hypothetical protein
VGDSCAVSFVGGGSVSPGRSDFGVCLLGHEPCWRVLYSPSCHCWGQPMRMSHGNQPHSGKPPYPAAAAYRALNTRNFLLMTLDDDNSMHAAARSKVKASFFSRGLTREGCSSTQHSLSSSGSASDTRHRSSGSRCKWGLMRPFGRIGSSRRTACNGSCLTCEFREACVSEKGHVFLSQRSWGGDS